MGKRQASEIFFALWRNLILIPAEAVRAQLVNTGQVHIPGKYIIAVALNGHFAAVPHQPDAFFRMGALGNDISQRIDMRNSSFPNVFKGSLKSGQVSVNIGYNGDLIHSVPPLRVC